MPDLSALLAKAEFNGIIYLTILLKGISVFFTLAFSLTILRVTGASEAGLFFSIISGITIFGSLAFGGLTKELVRSIAVNGYNESLHYKLQKLITIMAFLFCALGSLFWALNNNVMWMLSALIGTMLGISSIASAVLRGSGRHVVGNIEAPITRPAITLLLIGLVVLMGGTVSLLPLLFFYFVSAAVGSIYLALKVKGSVIHPKKIVVDKNYRYGVMRLTGISFFDALILNIDILIVAFVLGSDVAAELKVVYVLRNIILLPLAASNLVLPYLLASNENSRQKKAAVLFVRSSSGATALGALLISIAVGPELIARIVGFQVNDFILCMVPFCFMVFIVSITGPSYELVVARRLETPLLVSLAFLFAAYIPVAFFNVDEFGLPLVCCLNACIVIWQYLYSYFLTKSA